MSVYFDGQEIGPVVQYIPSDTSFNQLKGMLDGTLKEIDAEKLEITEISPYRFREFTKLEKANLRGIKEIPTYLCYHCSNLKELILDDSISKVGDYAFSSTNLENMIINGNNLHVGNSGFSATKLKKILGSYKYLGQSAFDSNTECEEVDIKLTGYVSAQALMNLYNVSKFRLDKSSELYSLNGLVFSRLGSKRANPENNRFEIDLSNSSFTTIEGSAFSGDSNNRFKCFDITFPKTLTKVNYALGSYSDNVVLYFLTETPPSIATSWFSNATNYKICVPWQFINKYKTATNWVTYTNNIIGYMDSEYLEIEQELPLYSTEGYKCTWYTDTNLTNQVNKIQENISRYYCVIDTNDKLDDFVVIKRLYYADSTIKAIDSVTNHSYLVDEAIPVGTTLNLVVDLIPENYIPYEVSLNGEAMPSTYTTVSGIELDLISIYYDGMVIPAHPDLDKNSWEVIKRVVQEGEAGNYWKVGDIKNVSIEDTNYRVRLSDLTSNRYKYSNEQKRTNAVFEFVDTLPAEKFNNSNTNAGGWNSSTLRTKLNTEILAKLPAELSALLEYIDIPAANGGRSNNDNIKYYTEIIISSDKLFFPSTLEVGFGSSYTIEGEGTCWNYYKGINSSSDNPTRIKYLSGKAAYWWTRTGSSNYAYYSIDTSGRWGYNSAHYTSSVSPCFAW